MRWRTAVLASGALVVLGGVAAAATLLSTDHTRDISGIVSASSPKASTGSSTPTSAAPPPNPLAGATFFVDPDSLAAKAVAQRSGRQRSALRRIAQTPQAFWYGDWVPGSAITAAVSQVVRAAADHDSVPVLVTY